MKNRCKNKINTNDKINKKNTNNIIMYTLICLLWCIIGIFIGKTLEKPHHIVGIYHTYNWYNNTEATIALKKIILV